MSKLGDFLDLIEIKDDKKYLNVKNKNIISFEGLNCDLYYLDISYNDITSFDGLRVNIENLDISYNDITSFDGLRVNIENLNISCNDITSFDGLKVDIEKLDCRYNQITSFESKANIKNLKFTCDSNVLSQGLNIQNLKCIKSKKSSNDEYEVHILKNN